MGHPERWSIPRHRKRATSTDHIAVSIGPISLSRKVAVVGGTGVVGSILVGQLTRQGHSPVVDRRTGDDNDESLTHRRYGCPLPD